MCPVLVSRRSFVSAGEEPVCPRSGRGEVGLVPLFGRQKEPAADTLGRRLKSLVCRRGSLYRGSLRLI